MAPRGKRIAVGIQIDLDAKALRAGAAEVAKLAAALRNVGKAAPAGNPLGGLAKALPQVSAQAKTAERSMLALARAQAAAAKEAGDTAGGVRILNTALQNATSGTVAYVNAQRQAARYSRELEQGANRGAGSLNGLSGAAASFGQAVAGAFAVERVARFGAEMVGMANQLEDAKFSLKTISGDQDTYNKTLEVAAQNQRLFGGSMAENIESMSGFVISARLAGVELEQLLDLSQRLATLDPGQGAAGASIALRELLSGNEKSLAMRFELPKAALKAMGDESLSASEKLAALSGFLDSVGVTSEAIRGKVDNNSQAFRDLQASVSNAIAILGTLIQTDLAPWAAKAAAAINSVFGNIANLTTIGEQSQGLSASLLEGAEDYEQYSQRVAEAQALATAAMEEAFAGDPVALWLARLGGYEPVIEQLTHKQFELASAVQEGGASWGEAEAAVEGLSNAQVRYAEGLMAGGTAAGEAASQARAYGDAIDAVNGVQGKLYDDAAASSDQLAELGGRMLEVATSSEAGASAVAALASEYLNGEISANTLEDRLIELEGAQLMAALAAETEADGQRIAAGATEEKTYAATTLADALMEQAAATDDSTLAGQAEKAALEQAAQAAQEKANAGASLEAQMLAVASALAASGGAGLAAANNFTGSIPGLDATTNAYIRLRAAMIAAGAATGQGAAAKLTTIGAKPTGTGKGTTPPPSGARGVATQLKTDQEGAFKPPPKPKGSGGGSGGGGGASAAKQTQEQLARIAQDGGAKIAEITADTAAKLVEIDRDAAAERAKIAAQLNEDLTSDAAAALAEREANDLELVGETDKKKLAKLQAREKAEAEAAQRLADAQTKAREQIANGEAELAAEQYEASKDAIEQRQELDEAYYEKQAELAGNPEALAELDKQYAEAVAAADAAAQIEAEIAAAKAEAKRQAVEDEKAAVIAAAEEQKAAVVQKATEQAEGVKGASAGQKAAVVGDLAAQAQAVTDWASAYDAAASKVADAASKAADAVGSVPSPGGGAGASAGGGTAAAGGGTFMTSGPQKMTVGDNPGGVELVTVTPLSGKGSTSTGTGMARMAGGGAGIAGLPDMAGLEGANNLIERIAKMGDEIGIYAASLENYAKSAEAAVAILTAARDLADLTKDAVTPIDPAVVEALAQQAREAAAILRSQVVPLTEEEVEQLDRYAAAVDAAAGVLLATYDLAESIAAPAAPINARYLEELAEESRRVGAIVGAVLARPAEQDLETLRRYAEAVGASVQVLRDVFALRKDLGDPAPPIDEALAVALAEDARTAALVLARLAFDFTANMGETIREYAANSASAIQVLRDTAALRKDLADVGPPIDLNLALRLAEEAREVALIVSRNLFNFTANISDAIARYAETSANTVSVLQGIAGLRAALKDAGGPISPADILRLAQEARNVLLAVNQTLIPTTEEEAAAVLRYADAVGAATSALASVGGLGAQMFTDYESPTDAQLALLVADARRIADAFGAAAQTMSVEGSAQAQAYADALGSTIGTAREALLLVDAIGARESWALDQGKLDQFEQSSVQLLATLARLGAAAAQIPAGDIGALERSSAALTGQANALIALSAVPFDNLAALGGAVGGGSSTTNTYTITIVQQPGQDARALTNEVIRQLDARVRSRV
jgi:hypothetical protein